MKDFETAAAVLIAIANCSPERFGALPTNAIKPADPYPSAFPPRNLCNNSFILRAAEGRKRIKIALRLPLNIQYTLTGRRSFVYTARIASKSKLTGSEDGNLIVKFSYQVSTRTAEDELVAAAHECGVDHLPKIHGWQDLWELKAGASHKRPDTDPGSDDSKFAELGGESRILRAIVYTQYYSIRHLFTAHVELIPIMVDQMIDCKFTPIIHPLITHKACRPA